MQLEITENGDFYAGWTARSGVAYPNNAFLYSSRFGAINITNHQLGSGLFSYFQELRVEGDEIWLTYTTTREGPPSIVTPFVLHGTVEDDEATGF